jgi:MerR family transcriptional regulator, copper efflux regulator
MLFEKRAKGIQFSNFKEFLEVHDQGELPCDRIKARLEDKLVAIAEQIQQLQILKQELKGLLSSWETIPERPEMTICPIIERN